jgi:hypothetical protein
VAQTGRVIGKPAICRRDHAPTVLLNILAG